MTTQGDYRTPAPSGECPDPASADGRARNAWVWLDDPIGSNRNWALARDPSGRPIIGAYYRLHECHPNTRGRANVTCREPDATTQIGCLVAASPCSLGFASRAARSARAVALQVDGVPNRPDCIAGDGGTAFGAYPFTCKLYLNTTLGFHNASAAGQALARCETSAVVMNPALEAEGYVPVPRAIDTAGTVVCPAAICGIDNLAPAKLEPKPSQGRWA